MVVMSCAGVQQTLEDFYFEGEKLGGEGVLGTSV